MLSDDDGDGGDGKVLHQNHDDILKHKLVVAQGTTTQHICNGS